MEYVDEQNHMKISISCSGGTLRSINLASQLDQRNCLYKLYVPYYSRKHSFLSIFLGINKKGVIIDLNKIVTNLKAPLLHKLFSLSHADKFIKFDKRFYLSEKIDKAVSRQINNDMDIIFAESNIALHTIRKAKECGIVSILDRTNSHILYQTELLEREYERLGIKVMFNSPAIIEKGLKEYQEADYISVLSSFVKRTFLERNIPESKLLLVPSGVNLADFKQIIKADNVFRIIYCGASCIKKGTHYLLKAFSELKLKNAELWLIGNTLQDIKPLLKNYEGIYKRMRFIPHNQLYQYLSQGSVFVLPSLEEGMAKVIIEAMACGLPIIATTNTGAEDVVRNGQDGFIIPIRDVDALKEKILFMYENIGTCKQMGQSSKERVRHAFTWEDYADRMIKEYKRILAKNSTGRFYDSQKP